jgi:hypothetical protein
MLLVALFAVQPAFAGQDVESELAEMRALVEGLKQKVDAQEEQLTHQGDLLEQAQGRIQAEDDSSGLSSFVDSLVVTGHVAGSYAYNLDDPRFGYTNFTEPDDAVNAVGEYPNSGRVSNFLPFHRDHNQFVVDQIWFGLGKPATAESRGGFQFDILFGNAANFLGQGTGASNTTAHLSRRELTRDSTSDYYIAQAFIEYQMPCEPCGDVNFKFGKFQTYVGSEVVQANGNYNITRGIVYNLLQPVDHLGLTATSNLGPLELTLGVLSSAGSTFSSPDNNSEKSYMASAAAGDDRLNGRVTFLYGSEGTGGGGGQTVLDEKAGLVDVVLNFNPADNLGLWVNSTYLYAEGTAQSAWGVALAGRLGITDDLGIALRGEFAQDKVAGSIGGAATGDVFGLGSGPPFQPFGGNRDSANVYSATATLDYALATNLVLKTEFRWDRVVEEGTEEFGLGGSGEEDQSVVLVEGVYSF